MNIVLWVLQVLMAVAFLMHGVRLIWQREQAKTYEKWVGDVPESLAIFIGIMEILGAVGLILPALTGVLPWLTLWAAVGLVLIMLLAIGFHLTRREYRNLVFNLVLLILVAVIAYGRLILAPFQ